MLDAVLGQTLEAAFVAVGKVVVRVVTFGLWRGERFNSDEARIYGPAGALSFKREGARVVTNTGCLFVGILFCALLALTLLVWSAA